MYFAAEVDDTVEVHDRMDVLGRHREPLSMNHRSLDDERQVFDGRWLLVSSRCCLGTEERCNDMVHGTKGVQCRRSGTGGGNACGGEGHIDECGLICMSLFVLMNNSFRSMLFPGEIEGYRDLG